MTHNQQHVIITAVCLAVVTGAATFVAALPELVVIPDAVAVGARGLAAGCLAVLYALGVSMQSDLFGRRPRRRQEAAGQRGAEGGRGNKKPSAPIGAQGLPSPGRATAAAAAAFGTSDRGVQRAKGVAAKASKKLATAVEAGELSLGKAEQIVKHPEKKDQDAQVTHIRASRVAGS